MSFNYPPGERIDIIEDFIFDVAHREVEAIQTELEKYADDYDAVRRSGLVILQAMDALREWRSCKEEKTAPVEVRPDRLEALRERDLPQRDAEALRAQFKGTTP